MIKRFDKGSASRRVRRVPTPSKGLFYASESFASPLKPPVSKTPRITTRIDATSVENKNVNNRPDVYPESTIGKKQSRKLRGKRRVQKRQEKKRLKEVQGSFRRRLWTREEDEAIRSLVEEYGIRKWTQISKKLQDRYHIHGRYGKQCRER
eukprot:TRINITY_DN12758_c0_g1_i5.p2 TRINITY_DN12758_c0_g1~~TRINITY_DN12758_c0_g1_i5.p2  ORF type:complete len:151 (-),score=26.11 TRINITY_DN12758_c0_g1_i5:549-1001(-)